ncbi:MAG TPA: hypothetical protein VKA44_04975 [Gemmatimonadota bacterium]|nr:hypothetical protein [Gemmatimonadota bacterium]
MARHNRQAKGVDQHGELWHISYQPDWMKRVKISRQLPDGRRRSTVTLFKNEADQAEAEPGKVVRTRVEAADGSAAFQVSLEDDADIVERIVVITRKKRGRKDEEVHFVFQADLDPADDD